MPSKPRKEPKKPSTPKAAAQEDRMRRVREESRQRHHDREVLQQQSRAALDKEPLTPAQAAKQLRAYAELLPGHRANKGEEIAGSVMVKMARLGAFAAYPEAQSLLTAHAAKSPTVSRIGAWMDASAAIRRQRGLPCENLFETFSEDAAFAAGLIESDLNLAKLPGACPVRTDDAAAVIKAADAVFEAWGAMCVYANRNAQYTDIGAKAAGKEELLRRFNRREEAARHAEQRIDEAIGAISTVDAALESVTGEKPRVVLAKAKPALKELKSIVGLSSPLDKRYGEAMETVAAAQRVARGLDFAEQRPAASSGRTRDQPPTEPGGTETTSINGRGPKRGGAMPRYPKVKVDVKKMSISVGESRYAVGDRRLLLIVQRLIEAEGHVVVGGVLKEGMDPNLRVDRLLDTLPEEVKSRIESRRGVGYWFLQ